MASARYRRFLKLCEEWPVEETKRGRDLGVVVRQRVMQAFREGENTQIADPVTCDEIFESLTKIHTNYYKNKYPRLRDTNFSGVPVEECKLVLATEQLKQLEEGRLGKLKRLREKFSTKHHKEDSK
ncbi:ubiquinol-cytochrome c reductase complex assembly factor 2 [Vipera latastei]